MKEQHKADIFTMTTISIRNLEIPLKISKFLLVYTRPTSPHSWLQDGLKTFAVPARENRRDFYGLSL